ncbi:SDR family NAD(P)-dependent oxidoreductase [Phytomonospora sp. NPDC050363]|uniref:SDR family NAD(P)-dependent oxidoreductase n=1 Tax=Phytomonospora sp. NPDC050363 TaxID=3155642 RepID=UPI0033C95B56
MTAANRDLDALLSDVDTGDFDLLEADSGADDAAVAVIGMAARVGETTSPAEFWAAVSGGADLIGDFPEARRADADALKVAAVGEPLGAALPYGYLGRVDLFDPERFAISPGEAALMDPHQRLFLTVAMQAVEDSGYGGDALRGSRTGVYVASGASQGLYLTGYRPSDPASAGMAVSGDVNSVIASRISHFLDLRGPALVVDTACSSSLAAVITACRDIRDGVVDTAVAGGVRLTLIPPEETAHRFGIEAPSGRTRAFSDGAEGTGGGEGVVSLVLKSLRAALDDGDHVYGVIRGSAMNQDGASAGITAPNAGAQADVIRDAWRDAGVEPTSVSYVEAHGTATVLGDPVEITGLTEAFATYTDRRQFCAVGSVKTNVGHLDPAAGITGLLKVLLMLEHRELPPSLHFGTPNPQIDFAESPVYLGDRRQDWTGPSPLRAGVSSFGISGTNCHVIVDEAPARAGADTGEPRDEILALSARTPAELDAVARDLRDHLAGHPEIGLADVCLTIDTGRSAFEHRACLIAADRAELLELLDAHLSGDPRGEVVRGSARVVADATGLGEGYIDAGTFDRLSKQAAELCEEAARAGTAKRDDLLSLAELFTAGARVPWHRLFEGRDVRRVPLPAYQGSPRRIWRPAATVAPAAPARWLHPLVHRHAVEGRDLDVFESDLSAGNCFELGEHVINGRHVLVGTAIIEMAHTVSSRLLGRRPLLRNLHYRDPLVTEGGETRRLQCVVTRDGDALTLEFRSRAEGSPVWTEHCRVDASPLAGEPDAGETVDVADLLARYELVGESVSYHRELVQTEGRRWRSSRALHLGDDGEVLLRYDADPETAAAKSAYALFPPILDSGVNLGLIREEEPYLPLAFERAEFHRDLPDAGYCWAVPADRSAWDRGDIRTYHVTFTDLDGRVAGTFTRYSAGRVRDPGTFLTDGPPPRLHEITWLPAPESAEPTPLVADTVVLAGTLDEHPLVVRLSSQGATVQSLAEVSRDENYCREWADGIARNGVRRIVHFVCADDPDLADGPSAAPGDALRPVFALVRALALRSLPEVVEYALVTRNGQRVRADDVPDPAARAVAAAALCLDAEYANIRIRVVDVDEESASDDVAAVVLGERRRPIVAIRHGAVHEPAVTRLGAVTPGAPSVFADLDGVVVVTGGTGGMGLALAAHLTEVAPGARVALVNRRHDDRDQFSDLSSELSAALVGLADRRGRVSLWRADVTDGPVLERALDEIRRTLGPIVGVVHAAGIPGDGFAINKTWEEFERVLAPKAIGARLLDRATRTDPLRFFALCSSMTSVFGAPGQSDYAAANGYLDAYAARMRAQGRPALAVNWTGWRDSGMARRHGITGTGHFAEFVGDTDGCELLGEALAAPSAQLLAGAFFHAEVRRQWEALDRVIDMRSVLDESPEAAEPPAPAAPAASSPLKTDAVAFSSLNLRGRGGAQLNDTVRSVAVAWCTTLGTDELDMHDPFFESGGNSLLASRLQLELDRRFPGVVNIADIFIYPTVAQLSEYVDVKSGPPRAPAPVSRQRPAAAEPSLSELLDGFLAGTVSIDEVVDS